MSFLDDFKNTKPAADNDGDFFEGPKDSGIAVLKDAQVFKGNGDPHTYKLLFHIKESTGPNAQGSTRVVLKKLDTKQYDKGYAKTQVATMVGLPPEDPKVGDAFVSIFRLDENGWTKKDTKCPLAGVEFKFNVKGTTTKKGEEQYHPTFSPVAYESKEVRDAAIAANKVELGL